MAGIVTPACVRSGHTDLDSRDVRIRGAITHFALICALKLEPLPAVPVADGRSLLEICIVDAVVVYVRRLRPTMVSVVLNDVLPVYRLDLAGEADQLRAVGKRFLV